MAPAVPEDSRSDPVAMDWFFQNALDPFLIVRDGVILNANPAWERLTGWSAEQSVGRGYGAMLHPEDREMIRDFGERLKSEAAVGGEHRVLTQGGDWLWVRTRLHRAADGRAMVVMQDIGGERAAAQEAQEAARVGEMLSMAAGVFVWRYSPASHGYEANTLTGGAGDRRGRITLTDFDRLIHPDDRERVNGQWALARRTGAAATVEYRSRQDATWRRLRTAWQGVRQTPDGAWDMLGITQDITELADARDAALAAAEAKAQFLANMSHEIRTPMNGVLGVLHILKARDLPGDSRALIEEAVACGSTLAQLLNDIVDFSKIESGHLDLSPEPVDLESVVDVVASMLRPEAEGRGLYLITDAPVDAGWASLDPVRLRQMLFNLLGNAVKFTYRGGVRVTASVSGADAAQMLRVEIKDTGVGIAPAAQASLFERFQQADGSATRRFGGSGLGLAVTKALAQQMGGRIGFESREGEGSTFWIETPAPACAPPAPPSAEASQWLAGLHVLVVEDNVTNRLVATRMLSDLGATVDTAEDGAEGVACAQKTPYDLIFMDIQMPVMDGVEATRRIRALPGDAAHTPIVATTANVLAHQVETYRQVGMDGCVAKPISPAALLGEIARLAGTEAEAA